MHLLKKAILVFGDLIGLNWLFRKINADKVRVLMYHGVTSQRSQAFCWTVLDKGEFAWQMQYLKRHYSVQPASEVLLDDKPSGDLGRNVTVITFDDGLENNFTEAWPILANLNLRAICFVLPGLSQRGEQIWADDLFEFLLSHPAGDLDLSGHNLGIIHLTTEKSDRAEVISDLIERLKALPAAERNRLIDDLMPGKDSPNFQRHGLFRLMTVNQINELAAGREFEIGLHTDSHPIMSTLTPEQQEREITGAIENLKIGEIRFLPIFAYPNGRPQDFNGETIAALKRLKIHAAVTTVDTLWERSNDRYNIPRIGIGGDISRWEFKARLSGFFYYLMGLAGR